MSGATGITEATKPEPGNVTICIYCGHIMAFDKDLTMRALTDEEMFHVAGNQDVIKARKVIEELRRRRDAKKA